MKIVGKILLGASFIMVLTASRCSSAAKLTKEIEVGVNKITQTSKKLGNKAATNAAENPNIQRGAAYGSYRILNNATRSNAQTSSQPRYITCPGCNGVGKRRASNGQIEYHVQCNGTGKIWIK